MIQKTRFLVMLFTILFSCQSKVKLVQEEMKLWEGKWVTKTRYDSLLKKHTRDFVENYFKNNPSTDSIPSPCLSHTALPFGTPF
jgi:hypothetical protein